MDTSSSWKLNPKGFYKGPLPFLLLFYFDRIQKKSIMPPRTPPIISVWTKDMVVERMKLESHGVGLGNILPGVKIKRKTTQEECTNIPMAKEEFMEEFISVVRTMEGNCEKLCEMIKHAEELFPNNLLYKTVGDYMQKKFKDPSNPSILSQDEELFGTNSFLNALDKVEKEYLEKVQAEKKAREKEEAKGKKVRESFDPQNAWNLGIDKEQTPSPMVHPTETQIGQNIDLNLGLGMGGLSSVGVEQEQPVIEASEFDHMFKTQDPTFEDILNNPLNPEFQYAGSKGESKNPGNVSKDKTTSEIEIGKRPIRQVHNLPACLKSPFMVKYKDLFKDVNAMNATISDYAFNDGPNNEVMYFDGETSINRSQMKTLGTDEEIDNSIIDAWATILNYKCRKNNIYFSTIPYVIVCTDHIVKKEGDTKKRISKFISRLQIEMKNSGIKKIKEVKQFFFPVSAINHFYLVCFNMYNATVDMIDNRKLPMNMKAKDKYGTSPIKMGF
ncbi:uncharacterized protein LOC110724870 isoform X2 [Chenopodium quinoa]|uniref:uncharacterized protein LOC110724870 isoform X2 n=1 Tax=Chenopodium quinoa TaxID=63459 RepID=UPI000B77FDCC|nr:uncharacterized protein LOC110724870 isoform X2 [Chenopodium quinoa]